MDPTLKAIYIALQIAPLIALALIVQLHYNALLPVRILYDHASVSQQRESCKHASCA